MELPISSIIADTLEEFRRPYRPNIPQKSYLALENFFSEFEKDNGLGVSGSPAPSQTEDDFLRILSRFMHFKDKTSRLLDEFLRRSRTLKNTGSFEIIWDDIITDSEDDN